MAHSDTNRDDTFDTTLLLPSMLALLFVFGAAGLVWFTQIRPSTVVAVAEPTTRQAASAQKAAVQASTGDPAAGQKMFAGTCGACHGPAAKGIQGLGKDLTTSQFVASLSDVDLINFVKVGRGPSDPLNTTGVSMPPKGGNPALSEKDLNDIVTYIRSIHE